MEKIKVPHTFPVPPLNKGTQNSLKITEPSLERSAEQGTFGGSLTSIQHKATALHFANLISIYRHTTTQHRGRSSAGPSLGGFWIGNLYMYLYMLQYKKLLPKCPDREEIFRPDQGMSFMAWLNSPLKRALLFQRRLSYVQQVQCSLL